MPTATMTEQQRSWRRVDPELLPTYWPVDYAWRRRSACICMHMYIYMQGFIWRIYLGGGGGGDMVDNFKDSKKGHS